MKIATIIGARPQFIKAAAVSRAIAAQRKNEGRLPFFSQRKLGVVPVFSHHLAPRVLNVGDVMADALQFAAAKIGTKAAPQTTAAVAGPAAQASAQSDIVARLGLQPQRYLLATIHRAENTDDLDRLGAIITALSELAEEEPVILPLHTRTRKKLAQLSTASFPSELGTLNPEQSNSLRFIDPVGYFDIVALETSARLLLTDSGGMQKEAYWLKVPCITLRDETEWVETVDAGWNVLTDL